MTTEDVVGVEDMPKKISLLEYWWGMLKGTLTSHKMILQQQAIIAKYELDLIQKETRSDRALAQVEQAIMKLGNSTKSARTIRHELLALIDKIRYRPTE